MNSFSRDTGHFLSVYILVYLRIFGPFKHEIFKVTYKIWDFFRMNH